jgi:hypothetical protein
MEKSNIKSIGNLGTPVIPKRVFDIEVADDTHTFIGNDILLHNSVYVSFDPLFKSMTEESQKKFTTDSEKLNFISNFAKDFLNDQNNEWCRNIYEPRHAHSFHEFELESIQKTQMVYKKKKYIKGVVWMKGKTYDEPKLSATGIELARSSTPFICRDIMKELIRDMMFVYPHYDDINEYTWHFNELLAKNKDKFYQASIEEISNSVSIGNYTKYVVDDTKNFVVTPGCPVSVKSIAYFNYLAHKHGQHNLVTKSGKIKYYFYRFGSKKDDIGYFGYPIGEWQEWFPKCDKLTCWDKNVITPMNRFAEIIKMPKLNALGSFELNLFS